MGYTLLKILAPLGSNARPGYKLSKINGVTIHMTDNWGNKADAKAHANYLKGEDGSSRYASWHYCIDDTYTTQSIPDNEVAYHCEDEIGNSTTIAIEICLNPESNLVKACDNAAELAAILLNKYNLSINKLYRHYDWSGKICPSEIMNGKPYTWNEFKNKVKSKMSITNEIKVGNTVNFDGKSRCYTESNGGVAGIYPPAGEYKITHYNPGSKYPIHIGSYGWVPESSCNITSNKILKVGSQVKFDGKTHCYATSNGEGKGMIPPMGIYIVLYHNPGSKYPIHIGTYGWVSESSCKLI